MAKSFFQRIPFIRISSLFIPGIVVGYFLVPDAKFLTVCLTILLSLQVLLWNNGNFSVVRLQNGMLSLTIFLLGVFYAGFDRFIEKPEYERKAYFLARVGQKPAEKASTYQTILSIQNNDLPRAEKVVAYFAKSEFDSTITTGDQLVILGKLQPVKNRGNPFEFDYRLMMHRRGIRYSVYLTRATYLKIGKPVVNLQNWAEKSRDYLVAKLADALPDKEERAVVSALTLGYRTELDQETLDYFASTGAMHVLSVSGLHVALLFMIMGFVLGFLKRTKTGRVFFPIVMILFLWIYAFISGFSPPVQRATVMFTFVIVGNEMRRRVNIYNSLTASAFLLTLADPRVVFDVGFQLSYLALFGIVLVQPALFNLVGLKNKFLKGLWALFTVSIAAQLVTFPLCVYYFNQFPNFFWLSNFFVVPLTTLIMWAAIAFFILSPVPVLAASIGFVIQKLCWFMLASLKLLDAHPLAVTHGLVFSVAQLFVVFGIIFSMIIFFFTKRKAWLAASFILVIGFQADAFVEKYKLLNQRFFVVYNSKSTIFHFANGRHNYLVVNDDVLTNPDQKMVQKVLDHYKLDMPVVINRRKIQNFKSADLCLTPTAMQYLNLKICFTEAFQNKTEEFSLTLKSKSGCNTFPFASISTGYESDGKPGKLVRYIKTEGAFCFALK